MQATTVLYGQVLVVLAITLSGVWGVTQWTAAALGYLTDQRPGDTLRLDERDIRDGYLHVRQSKAGDKAPYRSRGGVVTAAG